MSKEILKNAFHAHVHESSTDDLKLSKSSIGDLIDIMRDIIIRESNKAGSKGFRIPGLGTFKITEMKARKGINPSTKEPINIKARKVPRFKAAKEFKDAANGVKPAKVTKAAKVVKVIKKKK